MRDQLLGGRYRLVRQLGEGGMGHVWEAQDESLGRRVAVKVISLLAGGGSRGGDARARFLREAQITAQLQHPNIVTIHDIGETGTRDDKVPFLVMELVRGEGLDTKLSQGSVTLPDAAQWGAQICDALAEAHHAGIMHRDIKPSNVLVTPSGMVKVLDFGIARAADPYATADRLTQTGFIVGTPPYMAPEQARGFPEPRSDLYALGCLLFELITGRLPFQAPDTVGYLSAHLTQEPPAPSSMSAEISPAWDSLVLTLLRKDPAQRYPNAEALSRELRQLALAPEPAPPTVVRTRPFTTQSTTPLPSVPTTPATSKIPSQPSAPPLHPSRESPGTAENAPRAAQPASQFARTARIAETARTARTAETAKKVSRRIGGGLFGMLLLSIPLGFAYIGLYMAIGGDLQEAEAGDCLWFDTKADREKYGYGYADVAETEPCALPFRAPNNRHYVVVKRIDGTNDYAECGRVSEAVVDANTSILKSTRQPYWVLCVKPA
ncbi:protein kinase [Streptomyces sp. NPDC001930]|uniref:serine/threonine-protein kinase n=1 Tax=Streptomyces sp. NPDC001930 TaxID=3364625 RepID=UPI0036962FE0